MGPATTWLASSGGETWPDEGRRTTPLAWPKCAPTGGGRIQRWARRPGGVALCGGAFESTGAAANPDLCRCAGERSRSRGRPPAVCASAVVRLPARCRSGYRRVCGPGGGAPRASAPSLAVSRRPLSHRGRHPPHPPAPSGPASPPPPTRESGYCLVVEGEALANAEEENGWTVLATTVSGESGAHAEILQAYQDQTPTVEPGFRGIKNPAAIAPVWLEKPER